ncbi:MAG: EamA family transporter [Patescibacteria group bacterium]|jgi:transporter family protein
MTWQILAVIAPFLWACTNIIDKLVMEKYARRSIVPIVFDSICGVVIGAALVTYAGWQNITPVIFALGSGAGLILLLASLLYFAAVRRGDISRLVPMLYFVPLFVAVLAAVFLNEVFPAVQYVGVLLLVSGAILVSYQNGRIVVGSSMFFLLAATMLWATAIVIEKGIAPASSALLILGLTRFGAGLALPALLYFGGREFLWTMRQHGVYALGAMGSAELLGTTAELAFYGALILGPATLVSAVSAVQPFYVLVLVAVLGFFVPSLLEGRTTAKSFLFKFVGIVVMAAGSLLVT